MGRKMVDIIENIGVGLNIDQLAQNPLEKEGKNDERDQRAGKESDETDRK